MNHSEDGFQRFYHLPRLYAVIDLQDSKISKITFLTSGSFFALSLWPLNGMFWRTQFHSIYYRSDSFPGFVNTSLVLLMFFLFVKSNTLFIRTCLLLYHCLIQGYFSPPLPFWNCPLFCALPPKIRKSCILPHLRRKHNERHFIWKNKSEHTKFTYKLTDHNRFHRTMVLKAISCH